MIYSCIDIGTDTIKMVVGRIKNNKIDIIGSVNTRMSGIKKGRITDSDMVLKAINLANEELEKIVGFKIDRAVINVPFYDVMVDVYHGECYPDGEITGDDVITCFKSSVMQIDMDREVVTVCPIDFLVDGEIKCDDPKGVHGEKLESRMLISTVPKDILYPYLEVLEKAHIEVIDLSFGVINSFYMMDKDKFQEGYGALVDIGASKTEIGIFNKGLLIKGETIPVGAKLVDNDISYIYHVDRETARGLKENFAFAMSKYADSKEIIDYDGVGENEKITINQVEISDIVNARLDEILKIVKKTINNLTNHEISYIIISGGITNIPGFEDVLNQSFKDIAYIANCNIIGIRNNIYISCVGMIKYYYDKLKVRGIKYTMYDNLLEKIKDKKKNIRKNVIEDMKKYCEDN